jgi:hypothetical protein
MLAGATNSTLIIPNVGFDDAGTYKAVVFNSYGFDISRYATLTVTQPPTIPVITNQPASQTVAPGSTVTLTVGYSGNGPFSFQWRRNGVNLPQATNETLTLSNVQATDAGDYSVVVFTDAGATASDPAAVRVTTATLQFTDAFGSMVNLPVRRVRARSTTPGQRWSRASRSMQTKMPANRSGLAGNPP